MNFISVASDFYRQDWDFIKNSLKKSKKYHIFHQNTEGPPSPIYVVKYTLNYY
jgi:hypothetical protein